MECVYIFAVLEDKYSRCRSRVHLRNIPTSPYELVCIFTQLSGVVRKFALRFLAKQRKDQFFVQMPT